MSLHNFPESMRQCLSPNTEHPQNESIRSGESPDPLRSLSTAVTRREGRYSQPKKLAPLMETLIKTVRVSSRYLIDIELEYLEETKPIRKYASQVALDELWMNKLLEDIGEEILSNSSLTPSLTTDSGSDRSPDMNSLITDIGAATDDVMQCLSYLVREKRVTDREVLKWAEQLKVLETELMKVSGRLYEGRRYVKEYMQDWKLLLNYMEGTRYIWEHL